MNSTTQKLIVDIIEACVVRHEITIATAAHVIFDIYLSGKASQHDIAAEMHTLACKYTGTEIINVDQTQKPWAEELDTGDEVYAAITSNLHTLMHG